MAALAKSGYFYLPLSLLQSRYSFVHCNEEVEYKHVLWYLLQSDSSCDVSEISFPLVVLPYKVHLFYLIECLDNWYGDCAFKCRLRNIKGRYWWAGIISRFLQFPVRLALFIMSWHFLGGLFLKVIVCCQLRPPVFLYYFHYIVHHRAGCSLSGASPCRRFPSVLSCFFLGLACDGLCSAEGGSRLLRIWDSGMLILVPCGVCESLDDGHFGVLD